MLTVFLTFTEYFYQSKIFCDLIANLQSLCVNNFLSLECNDQFAFKTVATCLHNTLLQITEMLIPYTCVYKTHFFPQIFVSKSGCISIKIFQVYQEKLIPNANISVILFIVT